MRIRTTSPDLIRGRARGAAWILAGPVITCCVLSGLTACSSAGPAQPTAARTATGSTTGSTAPAGAPAPPGPAGASGPGAGPGGPAAPSSVEPPGGDHDDDAEAAPAAQAAPAAAAFATAWTRQDLTAEQWWAQVSPLCTPAFAAKLRSTDPANVPASQVTGPPVAVRAPAEGLAVYDVPTDAGTLTVTVTSVAGRWLASDNTFRRAAQ